MTPTPAEADRADVTILGGGIIGVTIAAYLAETGTKVLVLDRSGICEEAGSGNAGAFAFADILPLAQKGMLREVPHWLMDPLGPLSIPPTYLPRIMPWLVRFLVAGRASRFEAAVKAQASLMELAQREWLALLERSGTSGMVRQNGALELYESKSERDASAAASEMRQRYGIPFQHIDGDDLAEFQPGLSSRFRCATFLPNWKTVSDPRLFGQAIWAYANRYGAAFNSADIIDVSQQDEVITLHTADGQQFRSRKLVVAAGAWSKRISRMFGDPVPLETERGYNTTLPVGAFDVHCQLTFPRHGFVITPLETGIRIGGAVEFGGLNRLPNYARSEAMLKKAASFLPGLARHSGRQWMGFRPSMPDSLPVIGKASQTGNVIYAFGHGHLGLTQAAATGRLIRELVLEQAPSLDLQPYRAGRFRN